MKKQPHKINVHDMLSWMEEKKNLEILYASNLPLKKLTIINGSYRVYRNNSIYCSTYSPEHAVNVYNEISE